jgi:hypothetical protein
MGPMANAVLRCTTQRLGALAHIINRIGATSVLYFAADAVLFWIHV